MDLGNGDDIEFGQEMQEDDIAIMDARKQFNKKSPNSSNRKGPNLANISNTVNGRQGGNSSQMR